MERTKNISNIEASKRSLYKIGAAVALLAALLFRRYWMAEAQFFFQVPVPTTVLEWFTLIQENRFLALVMLDFFDVVNNVLVGVIFFTLYYALKDTNEIYMKFANVICFVGIAVHSATNQTFAMFTLSDKYFAASNADKSIYLTAGEALLAINHQGNGFYVSMFLIPLAGLIISLIMLQSDVFSRTTAYFGLLSNGLLLSYFVTMVLFPTIGWIVVPLSSIPLMIWYILIGIRLYKLSKDEQ